MAPCCCNVECPISAFAAFEVTLKKEPNRLGRRRGRQLNAAEKSGDLNKALAYYEKIVAIAGDADKTGIDVADARATPEVALAEQLAMACKIS